MTRNEIKVYSGMNKKILFAGFCIGFFTACSLVNLTKMPQPSRDEAVKQGHAEYYLDKDNNKQWRWLPPCNGSK